MACTVAAMAVAPVAIAQVAGLRKATAAKRPAFVSNGNVKKTTAMQVWTPVNNKYFETFSFLPALSDDAISRQVDYIVRNNWTPTLEFAHDADHAYTADKANSRFGAVSSNYADNRYWTMWKLPMFGCTDGSQVLREIAACRKAFPDGYIRLVAFDAKRQVQVAGFLVNRPANATEFRKPEERSV